MKTLTVARHAKSSWTTAGLRDHDRPLNDRGLRDAPEMGRRLAEDGIRPDAIVSSSAVRALTTARAYAQALGLGEDSVLVAPDLYGAGPSDVVDIATAAAGDADHVMVVGHNPTMTLVINALSDAGLDHVPTCGVATIDLDSAKLLRWDFPKNAR